MQQGRTKLVRESIAVKMSSSCGHLVITKNLGVSGNECWHLDGHHLWESPNTKTLSDGHHLWEEAFIQHCHDKKYKKSKPGENFEKDKIYANLKCFTNIFKAFFYTYITYFIKNPLSNIWVGNWHFQVQMHRLKNANSNEQRKVTDEEPWARIATNKQQNSTILFLQINLVVKDQTTYHHKEKAKVPITSEKFLQRHSCFFFNGCGRRVSDSRAYIWELVQYIKSIEIQFSPVSPRQRDNSPPLSFSLT